MNSLQREEVVPIGNDSGHVVLGCRSEVRQLGNLCQTLTCGNFHEATAWKRLTFSNVPETSTTLIDGLGIGDSFPDMM